MISLLMVFENLRDYYHCIALFAVLQFPHFGLQLNIFRSVWEVQSRKKVTVCSNKRTL